MHFVELVIPRALARVVVSQDELAWTERRNQPTKRQTTKSTATAAAHHARNALELGENLVTFEFQSDKYTELEDERL